MNPCTLLKPRSALVDPNKGRRQKAEGKKKKKGRTIPWSAAGIHDVQMSVAFCDSNGALFGTRKDPDEMSIGVFRLTVPKHTGSINSRAGGLLCVLYTYLFSRYDNSSSKSM